MPRTRRCREPGCHNLCVHPMHYCEQHKDKEQQYLRSRLKWSHAHDYKHKQHVYNTVTRNRDDVKKVSIISIVLNIGMIYAKLFSNMTITCVNIAVQLVLLPQRRLLTISFPSNGNHPRWQTLPISLAHVRVAIV